MDDVEVDTTGHWGARPTFAGVPAADIDDLGEANVVIIGLPIDWGATYRPGARFGPGAIRAADYLEADGSRPHLTTGIDPMAVLSVVDVGDLTAAPGYLEEALDLGRQAVERIARHGAVPVVLGGDHSITYANASAVANVVGHGRLALVHFDAHADTSDSHFGHLYGHGTPMRRLIESGAVPGSKFAQVGLRGYWPPPDVVAWMGDQGMRWWMMSDIAERGITAVVDEALAHVSADADAVFISVDIDVVDPGMAPGTGTPEPGGMTSRDLLDTVRRLARELHVVGMDVVEVSPPYDGPGQITAFLANRVVLEALNGMAERRLAKG